MSETKNEKINKFVEKISKNNPLKSVNLKVNLKLLLIIFGAILAALLIYYFKGMFIAAVVNGKPISRVAVVKELEKQGGAQVLDSLVTKELIYGEAKNRGITATQEEVEMDIKNIENSLIAQGTTLDEALASQNLTRAKLVEELKFNKLVEKLVADKVIVTDEEVNQYITDNKATFPKDTDTETLKPQIRDTIRQQKLSTEVQALLQELKAKAKVSYWIRYN